MGDIAHSSAQTGNSTAITKKGIQHTTNAPVMMASVFAAFRSRFELLSFAVGVFFFNIEGLVLFWSLPGTDGPRDGFFHEAGIGCGGQLIFEGYATDILSVGGSISIRSSSPLPKLHFSGLVLFDETFVNAVVVVVVVASLIVGKLWRWRSKMIGIQFMRGTVTFNRLINQRKH